MGGEKKKKKDEEEERVESRVKRRGRKEKGCG